MLVLTRKVDESICIGDNIVITVTKISGDRVSIGIAAPSEVGIRRAELPVEHVAAIKSAKAEGKPHPGPLPPQTHLQPIRRNRHKL